MNKSSRAAVNSNPNRRYSQPVFASSSSMASSSRRGSDNMGPARAGDPLPPAVTQYEDKLTVVEAKGPRKMRGKDGPDGSSFDPDQYNPDGSLRKAHCLPDFDTAYAEASKARYIRFRRVPEREKELNVQQIFKD